MKKCKKIIIFIPLFVMIAVVSFISADEMKPMRHPLGQYHIKLSESSVSGLSAGGFFANQFFVAFSDIIKGVGVFSGGPYGCARGNLFTALNECMKCSCTLTDEVMNELYHRASENAKKGYIDPLSNLKDRKIYLFSGLIDQTVKPDIVRKVVEWYKMAGVPKENILFKNNMITGHTMPTLAYGNPCASVSAPPWMSSCEYDGAGEVLKHIYGPLNAPDSDVDEKGDLIEFYQNEFIDPPNLDKVHLARRTSFNEFGYAYIPKACMDGQTCRIHVVFHGCRQVYDKVPYGQGEKPFGLKMVIHSGYNEWAAENRLIILYPQIQKVKTSPYFAPFANPAGCFDWWGYLKGTQKIYDTKLGPQMKAVHKMLLHMAGSD